MTAYAERVEREDEEDRLRGLYPHYERLFSMGWNPRKYIGGTSLIGLDTSDRMKVWTKSTDTSGS